MPSTLSTVSDHYKHFLTSVSPKRATLFLIVVMGFLGGMAWVQVIEKEEYLVQRNFRLLNLWGQDITQRIQSYQKVFATGASGIKEALDSTSTIQERTTGEGRFLFIRSTKEVTADPKPQPDSASSGNKTEGAKHWVCDSGSAFNQSSREPISAASPFRYQFNRMCETEGLVDIHAKIKETESESHRLEVNSGYVGPLIRITYSSDSSTGMEIAGTVTLDAFLQRLTRQAIFSNVLLMIPPDGEASPIRIFQSGSGEISWESLKASIKPMTSQSWMEKLPGFQKESGQQHSTVNLAAGDQHFLIHLLGKSYRGFSHPISIPGTENQKWVLIGLVENAAFSNNTLSISSTVLLGVMITVLFLIIAIPLFHLKFLGPTDPLRLTHVLGLVLAALLGTGLVTFLALDMIVYWEGKQDLKERMERSAQTIKDRFLSELRTVLYTLEQFDHSNFLQEDFQRVARPVSGSHAGENQPVLLDGYIPKKNVEAYTQGRCGRTNKVSGGQQKSGGATAGLTHNAHSTLPVPCPSKSEADSSASSAFYSDFLYAFWMDPEGSMRINWARDTFQGNPVQGITDNIFLGQRKYVNAVLNQSNQLWQLPKKDSHAQPRKRPESSYSFFLEPIISWTTGYNTVVASMPSLLQDPTSNKKWVAAIEFQLNSLMDDVVLPPGIGFAVIDEVDHLVLFHSEPWRNLREKFLIETDENAALRDFLAAKTAGHAKGSYWGEPKIFYVLPLSPIPWSLVVFRDMEILRSINLVGLLVAGSLYGIWALVIYGILWIVLKRQSRHRKVPWLWPNLKHQHFYQIMFIHNLGWFLVGLSGIFWFSGYPDRQLLLGLCIPVLWLCSVAGLIYCRNSFSSPEVRMRFLQKHIGYFPAFPYSYSFMLTSCLLLLGVIPAFGSFSSVYHQEMTQFSQFQLLETFKNFQTSGKVPVSRADWQPFSPINAVGLDEHCYQKTAPTLPEPVSSFSLGLYPDFLLDSSWCSGEIFPQEQEKDHGLFQNIFALVSQPFVPLLKHVSLWGFVGNSQTQAAPDQAIQWETNPITLFAPIQTISGSSVQGFSHPVLQLKAYLTFMPWFLSGRLPSIEGWSAGKGIGYLLVVGLVVYWLIRVPKFIADRVLFLSYYPPSRPTLSSLLPTGAPELAINRLLLGFPGQGKTTFLTTYYQDVKKDYPGVIHFDFKAHPPHEWKTIIQARLQEKQNQKLHSIHVLLDHLDYQWKDPDINQQKLEFLEFLFHPSLIPNLDQPVIHQQRSLVAEVQGVYHPASTTTNMSPPV